MKINLKDFLGETSSYDKKREVERHKVRSWLKSVSAFANTHGGTLIFGIADDDTVIGLKDAKRDAEFISESVKTKISPVPLIALDIQDVGGKELLLLHVSHGSATPYYYVGDGSMEAYSRIGNESVKTGEYEHKRLVLKGLNLTYDALRSDYRLQDFNFQALRARYFQWTGKSFEDKFFHSFDLADEEGFLNHAGVLFADECPLIQNSVFCTRWNGLTKANGSMDALDKAELRGGLVQLIKDSLDFIKRNMRTMWYKEPTQRIEIPEYEMRSVTEVIVNAVAHRDYTILGSEIHIGIFDDRMEIYSPGPMPDGHVIQDMDLKQIPSMRRNPVIASVLSRLGFMEREGSGMGKILDAYYGMPYFSERMLPKFYSDDMQFTVTFPNIRKIWLEEHPSFKPTDPMGLIDGSNQLIEIKRIVSDKQQVSIADVPQSTQSTESKLSENYQKTDRKLSENYQKTGKKLEETEPNQPIPTEEQSQKLNDYLEKLQGNLNEKELQILRLLSNNRYLSSTELSEKITGSNTLQIRYYIGKLKQRNLLTHVGPDKGGYWEIQLPKPAITGE